MIQRNPNLNALLDLCLAAFSIAALSGCAGEVSDPPEVGGLEVHADLEVSLFASEPDILDPVALTFDARGRMYVVEMRDYPYGLGPDGEVGSTIRLLEDLDGDGVADRSTIFAEEISFPTSIVAWNDGVFVAAPPQILYLADRDGDRVAEVREVVYDGFVLGVTDSNFAGLRWGLDNSIHGVNGGNGGIVVGTDGDGPISIRGRDFRFDPRTRAFETSFETSSGFGLVFDDWGRSFTTYNIDHLQHRFLESRYLDREPALSAVDTTRNISDHGPMAEIYPISAPQTRPNHPEQSGFYSAAGGMGFLDFGPGLPDGILVGDVVGNLISRERLRSEGVAFATARAEEELESEFLASSDPYFRGVAAEHGPDGALYVADMHRAVIEHPDYIPESMLAELDVAEGRDRGRIYRVAARKEAKKTFSGVDLQERSSPELVEFLDHPRRWWRDTAQRLLIERSFEDQTPPLAELETMAVSGTALGRLHALWTLDGLGALSAEVVLSALESEIPELRENAVLLAESRLEEAPRLVDAVIGRADDPNPRIRFRVALALGSVPAARSLAPLMTLLGNDGGDEWMRLAVLSSLGDGAKAALAAATDSRTPPAPGILASLDGLADLVAARGEPLDDVLAGVLSPEATTSVRRAALEGMARGLKRSSAAYPLSHESQRLLRAGLAYDSSVDAARILAVVDGGGLVLDPERSRLIERSTDRLLDGVGSEEDLLADLRIVSASEEPQAAEVLLALLGSETPLWLQESALEHLLDVRVSDVGVGLVERWRSLLPALRPRALRVILRRVEYHDALLDALEEGAISLGELNLDLEQRRRLLRESTPEIHRRAARFMSDDDYGHRSETVVAWLERLPAEGDAERGRDFYDQVCAQCHPAGDAGSPVGPDLRSLRHRSVEDLASNILDPNMAINPSFGAVRVILTGGGRRPVCWPRSPRAKSSCSRPSARVVGSRGSRSPGSRRRGGR